MSNYYGTQPPIIQLRAKDYQNTEQTLLTCNFVSYATEMAPPMYEKIEDRVITLNGINTSLLYGYLLHIRISFTITEEQTTDFMRFWENLIAWEHISDNGTFSWRGMSAFSDYHDAKIYVKPYGDSSVIDYFEAYLNDYNLDNKNGLLFVKQGSLELISKQLLTDMYNRYDGNGTVGM